MGFLDFKNSSIEEAIRYVMESNLDQIESGIASMSPEQIVAVINQINNMQENDFRKTGAIIRGLDTRLQLEAAGKAISASQLLGLFNKTLKEEKHHWKLSPLLVGMPHETFSQLLQEASVEQLYLLQNEGVTEPVQHHLTLLGHEINAQFNQTLQEIELFLKNIDFIDTQTLTSQNVNSLFRQIDLFSLVLAKLLDIANKSLGIAWNTRRVDLIDSFSRTKNSCQKILSEEIGQKAPATGLYQKLESKLFSIFGDSTDPTQIDAVHDEEPVREALVKFSIWYLRDYWEIGLLPRIKNLEEFDLDLTKNSEEERLQFRQELFEEAQKKLAQLGLLTVKDLKKAHIFSRKTLEEYIQNIPK